MDELSLSVARAREGRPGLKSSRLVITIAHEDDGVHEQRHEAAISAAMNWPGVVFLGGLSDGEPFDKQPSEQNQNRPDGFETVCINCGRKEDHTYCFPGPLARLGAWWKTRRT